MQSCSLATSRNMHDLPSALFRLTAGVCQISLHALASGLLRHNRGLAPNG